MDDLAWIAADWGTSHLRLWLIAQDGKIIAGRESDRGMATLESNGYADVLEGLLGADLPKTGITDMVCCGMAGSRQGWAEAPYASVPCPPPAAPMATRMPCLGGRLMVHLLPGIRQNDPADVMRGEETQIAGVLAREPEFDGVICLPGTHSKWVRISAGEIVSFRTSMTGEMFALLCGHSVLRHSVKGEGWDSAAFIDAVNRSLSRPAGLVADLFTIRAESLLKGLGPATARARLSGLLIGMDLASARAYWLGQDIRIVGEDAIACAYRDALAAQSVPARLLPAHATTLAGLAAAFRQLRETH